MVKDSFNHAQEYNPMAKSANKGKKGSSGGKNSKQNQGNATANKAKNGGKKK
jgi:hypothetical protein